MMAHRPPASQVYSCQRFCAEPRWFRGDTYDFRRVSVLDRPAPTATAEKGESWRRVLVSRIRLGKPLSAEPPPQENPLRAPLLFESLREDLASRLETLVELENDVRQAAGSQAAAVASLTQERSSTAMTRLTVVLTILTAVLLALAVVPVFDGSSDANPLLGPTASPTPTLQPSQMPTSESAPSSMRRTQRPHELGN